MSDPFLPFVVCETDEGHFIRKVGVGEYEVWKRTSPDAHVVVGRAGPILDPDFPFPRADDAGILDMALMQLQAINGDLPISSRPASGFHPSSDVIRRMGVTELFQTLTAPNMALPVEEGVNHCSRCEELLIANLDDDDLVLRAEVIGEVEGGAEPLHERIARIHGASRATNAPGVGVSHAADAEQCRFGAECFLNRLAKRKAELIEALAIAEARSEKYQQYVQLVHSEHPPLTSYVSKYSELTLYRDSSFSELHAGVESTQLEA